jgi:molybdopterin converting factor small subunit
MSVTVKFFARLREEFGDQDRPVEITGEATVNTIWQAATGRLEMPAEVFCAVNHEHAAADTTVTDGDEVAFFPRITGGQQWR